ncbi:carbohydrate kinase family protein [Leifsonia sp. RAF41]|uniref:carbohydrate kinase family protein n=1 Tax=Leifsonia sp. RAF41 TaxID=3233056 RepID=UPI003F9946B2
MRTAAAARVFVVGESLVDVVEREGVRTAHPGGSPLNVAFGLARLGLSTTFLTTWGDDDNGRMLAAHLATAGVDTIVERAEGGTSVATAEVGANGTARYVFDLDWALRAIAAPTTAVFHTGSLGALLEPGATAVRRLVDGLHPDTVVTFDPNVRSALMPDRQPTLDMVGWYSEHAHLVKLSDEDAAWLFPGMNHRAVLDWIVDHGAAVAVLTLGERGSILRSRMSELRVEAPATSVVDTIGAGDAYMAGLIAGAVFAEALPEMRTREVTEDALRSMGEIASRVASLTVARAGAMPPTWDEIERVGRGAPQREFTTNAR